jgi:predicted metalloprotease with PDZ domain
MSTNKCAVIFMICLVTLVINAKAAAPFEDVEIFLEIDKINPDHLKVRAKIVDGANPGPKIISFTDSYADAVDLSSRITGLRFLDSNSNLIRSIKLPGGVYTVEKPVTEISYDFDASPPANTITAPHLSWLTKEMGLIKLHDILPDLKAKNYKVRFVLPKGWDISTVQPKTGELEYEAKVISDTVFSIGKSLKRNSLRSPKRELNSSVFGSWQFEDTTVLEMAQEIHDEYKKLFKLSPSRSLQINLFPFPKFMGPDRWRAQTQGATITIVSSNSTSKARAEQLLHEQLRHELFHLWIPESLKLRGDYAWFYEGFARYQSLKAGVWVGRIGFQDFLRSMSQAINIAKTDKSGRSLVEISSSQWLTGTGVVAAKGMAVAFFCDVLILHNTRGKKSVANLLGGLFRNNRVADSDAEATRQIELEFVKFAGLRQVFDEFVNGTGDIEWKKTVGSVGLSVSETDGFVRLGVVGKPGRRQRDLLNKLGYNRWEKFVP